MNTSRKLFVLAVLLNSAAALLGAGSAAVWFAGLALLGLFLTECEILN